MTTTVKSGKPDHHYRTEIPNIVFDLGIHPQALALYGYYKRVAGDESACWRSNATITKQLGMSSNTIIKYRKELCKPQKLLGGKSLINSKERKTDKGSPDTVLVQIVDIWRENGDFYRTKEVCKGSSKYEGGVPQNLSEGASKFEHKEEPFKKNPIKKKREGVPPSNPPRSPISDSSKKINRKPHVSTTDAEHLKLLDSHTEAQREEAYQFLSDWKEDTPKSKWKLNDYRSINRWVWSAIDEKKTKGKNGKSRANPDLSPEKAKAYDELF